MHLAKRGVYVPYSGKFAQSNNFVDFADWLQSAKILIPGSLQAFVPGIGNNTLARSGRGLGTGKNPRVANPRKL